MNIFEYVSKMQELGTPVALAGLGILAAFLVFIIFKMLGGLFKGTWNKLLSVAVSLVAVAISFGVGSWLSNHIIGLTDVKTFEAVITMADSYLPGIGDALRNAISSFDGELLEYLLLVPATLFVVPAITSVLFVVINFVLKFILSIITFILRLNKARSMTQRLGGAILSAVEGVIWVTMVVLPICAIISLVDQGYQKAIDTAEPETKTELVEVYDEYFYPFVENPALSFISSVGTEPLANGLATVKIENEKANIRAEVISIADIIIVDITNLKGADFTALNEKQQEAFGSILNALGDSPIMSRVLVNALHSFPSIYNNGLIPIELGGEFSDVLDEFMAFLETTARETIKGDLNTIKDFYFGFCDSGLLAAISEGQDIMQFVNEDYRGDKHILGMLNTLSGNDRTQGIVDELYNFVLNAAFSGGSSGDNESAGGGSEVLENIDIQDVKTGLNDIVTINKDDYATPEEYKEELSNTIGETINNTIGVELEKEVTDEIADFVDEKYGERVEELTDEEFNELMFEVIDIYQSFLNGEEINPDDLENLLP